MIGDRPLAHFSPGCQYGAPAILGAMALGVGICIAETSGPQRYGHFTSRDDLGCGEGFRERATIQNRDCRENKTSCRHRLRDLQSGRTRCGLVAVEQGVARSTPIGECYATLHPMLRSIATLLLRYATVLRPANRDDTCRVTRHP